VDNRKGRGSERGLTDGNLLKCVVSSSETVEKDEFADPGFPG